MLGINSSALAIDTSQHSFGLQIPAEDIPPGSPPSPSNGSSGISGGAITGITLGSIGGIALLSGLAWALKPYWAIGLKTGYAQGLDSPVLSMCLDDKTVDKFKSQPYPYLVKALEMNKIHQCPKSRYILVPDSVIKSETIDSLSFKIPKEMGNSLKIIITQISNPYEKEEFKTELYVNDSKNQVKLSPFLENKSNGIMQMIGEIDLDKSGDIGTLLILNEGRKDPAQIYAYLIEFSGI